MPCQLAGPMRLDFSLHISSRYLTTHASSRKKTHLPEEDMSLLAAKLWRKTIGWLNSKLISQLSYTVGTYSTSYKWIYNPYSQGYKCYNPR